MSKTYPEHCISLTDSAKDMFGKLMSIPDTLITRYYSLLTDVPQAELIEMDKQIESNSINPRDINMRLAYMITEEYHGKEVADKAQADFINVVSNKGIPEDIESVKIESEISVLELLVNLNFVASKGEAKRLIQGGGVKLDGEKVVDIGFLVTPNMNKVLQAGKRKFAKLI